MIIIKNSEQLKLMREAGRITAEALMVAKEAIRPGLSTKELDKQIQRYIEKCGATPTFLGYHGFPGSACISINDEVIHGIPSDKIIIKEGDIVKVDVGARFRGYNGDSARTFAVGKVSDEALRLISVTEQSFYEAMKVARPGYRIGDIGHAVESLTLLCVGAELHEEPEIPNYGREGRGARLYPGMTLAIEPMVNAGTDKVKVRRDGWTVTTADGKLSAHYENSIAITVNLILLL